MFILFGWRGVNTSAGRGIFFCPTCGGRCEYEHTRVRRFFTLFFIPVIPLDLLGEYVTCKACQSTLKPLVLEGSFQAQMRQGFAERERIHGDLEKVTAKVILLMSLTDGRKLDDARRQLVSSFQRKLLGKDIALVSTNAQPPCLEDVLTDVGRIGKDLSDKGKGIIISAAKAAAEAEGPASPQQEAILKQIAGALIASGVNSLMNATAAPPAAEPPPLPSSSQFPQA